MITEIIYGHANLDKKYFTFNNRFLNRNLKNKFTTFVYLIFLNISYFTIKKIKNKFWHKYQTAKVQKHKISQRLFYYIYKIIFSEFEHANGIFYWKERYDFFHETLHNYKLLIKFNSINFDYLKKKFKNYHHLDFVHLDKKVTDTNTKKNIDCLFTGQLTQHRKNILNKLIDSGIKVKYFDYLDDKKREFFHKKSKIYLGLKKFNDLNVPVGTRAWYCMENGFFVVNEDAIYKNNLYNLTLNIPTVNYVDKIKEILKNYDSYEINYKKNLESYRKNNIKNNKEIKKLINSINNII